MKEAGQLSTVSVKKLIEEKVKNSSNKLENKIQVTFNALKNDIPVTETITLSGEGSVKVLIPA